jgi:hypothetical protein
VLQNEEFGCQKRSGAELLTKKGSQRAGHFFDIFGFTFPYDKNFPPQGIQQMNIAGIALLVLSEFLVPKFAPCLWRRGLPTTWVSVPKAAIDEDYFPS